MRRFILIHLIWVGMQALTVPLADPGFRFAFLPSFVPLRVSFVPFVFQAVPWCG